MAHDAEKHKLNTPIIVGLSIVIVILVATLGFSHLTSYKSSSESPPTTTIPSQATTISSTTTVQSSLNSVTTTITPENNTLVEVLYSDKTVHIAAPQHNYNYSYVNGCYWIDGYSTFSFNAPYPGYVVFNETNTGEPSNRTFAWFWMYIATGQKPIYYIASPYNLTTCTGESFWAITSPISEIAPAKNQTMIIPVTNGTNYVVLYNNNAYGNWGLDNAINVTFSMKYVGFKPLVINNPFPNPFPALTQANVIAVNYSFTKVLVGDNITNSSIQGFKVNLAGIGVRSQITGIAPALLKVYYNNALVNATNSIYEVPGQIEESVFPGQNVSFNMQGHQLTVYVNQTDSINKFWATLYLSR